MWKYAASKILRNRIAILLLLGILTGYMAFLTSKLELSYGLPRILPENDSSSIAYEEFKKRFGNENIIYLLGIDKNPLNDLQLFNAWYDLGKQLNNMDGVDTVLSVANIVNIYKNTDLQRFELKPIVTSRLKSGAELDSIRNLVHALPFYKGRLYNDSTQANLMFISLNEKRFNSKQRDEMVHELMALVKEFSEVQNVSVHYSGMPFIRTVITMVVKSELGKFILMALFITVVILFFFFRSFYPVAVSILVVAVGVIWSLGTIALFGYKITILTSLIPPLIIVICVPNCIYLINKYHYEFNKHRNQAKALSRVIERVGYATFLTNATTAAGFGTFIPTHSAVLVEFGIIASINILIIFINGLLLIPIIFSFLPPPKFHQTQHLEKRWVTSVIEAILHIISYRRRIVYAVIIVLVAISVFGILQIQTTGNLADDLPKDHFAAKDLRYLERNFNGVMPFEIYIDAKKPGMAAKEHTLKRIEALQLIMEEYPQFSKPLSLVEGLKFVKQAYYNGNPDKYQLINSQEKVFFKPYLENAGQKKDWLNTFVDSTKQYTRITFQMADIGTKQMDVLLHEIRPRIDSVFSPDKYGVEMTGASVVFLKGTNYLVKNLFSSLLIAIVLIAVMISTLFASYRMILILLATNMVPLLLTAAVMGFFNIPVKPSTILVFSVAFGISVDDAIHYLTRYRQELKARRWNIGESVKTALKESGVSMIYTSIVLFFGFSIFATSDFGGTKALGILISFTLLVAMISNLVLLPSLLLSLERRITTQAFKEPLLVIYDEEEDINLDGLTIMKTPAEKTVGEGDPDFAGKTKKQDD